jgi:hypothetical protein
VLGALGVLCALIGLFLINGISIEFPGIVLGGLGYYFCLPSGARVVAGLARSWESPPWSLALYPSP